MATRLPRSGSVLASLAAMTAGVTLLVAGGTLSVAGWTAAVGGLICLVVSLSPWWNWDLKLRAVPENRLTELDGRVDQLEKDLRSGAAHPNDVDVWEKAVAEAVEAGHGEGKRYAFEARMDTWTAEWVALRMTQDTRDAVNRVRSGRAFIRDLLGS